jgi:signal transduction histidine kinase
VTSLPDEEEPWDATTAVVAHALLNSLAVISGASTILLDEQLPAETQRDLLRRINAQAMHVTGVLQDLVRGLPLGAFDALQHLKPEDAEVVED